MSRTKLFSGCLLSSIAHAIMTNRYPLLSFEQSWDGNNFSKQTNDSRMTVSFEEDFCVGAIRCNHLPRWYGDDIYHSLKKIQSPNEVLSLLNREALEYMLDYKDGIVMPVVSSIFWCNHERLFLIPSNQKVAYEDYSILFVYALSLEEQFTYWKDYYDMDDRHTKLLRILFEKKLLHGHSVVYLTDFEKDMLPGFGVNQECVESLAELNFFV